MKRTVLSVLVALVPVCAAVAASSPVSLDLKLEHASVLCLEPIHVMVTLSNDTERPLVIDENDPRNRSHVTFSVERKRDEAVARSNPGAIVTNFVVGSEEQQKLMVDLADHFEVGRPGRYLIKVVLDWEGTRYESAGKMVEVVKGLELASVAKNVPGYPKRIRTYTLRYWTRERREDLFLCVEEEATRTSYGVFCLGGIVRVTAPTIRVENTGEVIVKHQAGNECFVHTTFVSTADGVFFLDQSYRAPDGSPYLSKEKQETESLNLPPQKPGAGKRLPVDRSP